MSATVLNTHSPWIISRRDDLLWFLGSAFAGYFLLAIGVANNGMPVQIVLIWNLLINGPHVFSTATRVLFDQNERSSLGRRWLLIIPLSLIGPAILWYSGYGTLMAVTLIWGHYHSTKQNMGFMFLYRRKAGERVGLSLDKNFSLISYMLPLAYYLTVLISGSTAALPFLLIPALIFAVYYGFYSRRDSWPKRLLLVLTLPLMWLALAYAAADIGSSSRLLIALVATNVSHSCQYLRLMWFHNHNRYSARADLLGFISKRWFYFFASVVLLALPSHLVNYSGELAVAITSGLLFFHYTVDGWIWKSRANPELAVALRL